MHSPTLITGASSGIGAAVARQLAVPGRDLLLLGRDRDRLDAVAADVVGRGATAHVQLQDLRDLDAVGAWAAGIATPESVVLSAGLSIGRDALDQVDRLHDLQRSTATNFLGQAALLLPLLARMAERGHGRVVAVSTVNASIPMPGFGAYSASKAALDAWFAAIGPELRAHGVRLSVAELGLVRTPMIAPTWGDGPWWASSPERAARRIVHLLEHPRPRWRPWWAHPAAVAASLAPGPTGAVLDHLRRRR